MKVCCFYGRISDHPGGFVSIFPCMLHRLVLWGCSYRSASLSKREWRCERKRSVGACNCISQAPDASRITPPCLALRSNLRPRLYSLDWECTLWSYWYIQQLCWKQHVTHQKGVYAFPTINRIYDALSPTDVRRLFLRLATFPRWTSIHAVVFLLVDHARSHSSSPGILLSNCIRTGWAYTETSCSMGTSASQHLLIHIQTIYVFGLPHNYSYSIKAASLLRVFRKKLILKCQTKRYVSLAVVHDPILIIKGRDLWRWYRRRLAW